MGGLIATSVAIHAAVQDWGPLAVGSPYQTLALTWVFCMVVMTSSLISAALVEGTERARAEHQSGERRLRAVLDAASEGIVVADAAGIITHVNRAITTIWPAGLPVPTLQAPVAEVLAPLAAHAGTRDASIVLAATRGADMARGTLQLPDDQTWEVDVDPLSDLAVDGGRVWSFRDITARVRAETERRQLEAQLLHTQKLESLGVLAGGIAHDFNNLLMSIRGRAELIEMTEPLPREIRGDITGILRTTDEAAALCRQMLAYAGRGAIEVRTVDLSACAREIQDMLRVSVSRRVELVLELSAEPLPIAGDITQLRQIILNLVINASDAVEATGRGGTVRVRTYPAHLDRAWFARQVLAAERCDEAFAVLEVSDNGVGMDESTARQVFDPFFSSKGAGRGLGLAASLGVIRSHKGSLALTSAPEIGSRFEIALPMATGAPATPVVAESERPLARFGGRTVLVVDDEEGVRAVVTRMLMAAGLNVRQACDGDAALDAFATPGGAPIDVVLLDLTMPKRSGPATLTEMRARGIMVPVIIASGFSAEAVPEGAGIAGFVQKPFKRETLERAVADALAGASRT
jgi:signal transduction histidine kinase/CheY-like chemotaxis protein